MYWLKGIKNKNTNKPLRIYEYISFEPRDGDVDLALVEVEFEKEEDFLVYLEKNQKLSKK